jgi:RNA polymerase sigma-70 factor, ECF subfamily
MQTTLSDDELLRLMRAGDERAFLELYQGRGGAIYRFALRMSGSEAIAEDVTQEVFMTLINDLVSFDSARGSLSSYLFGIARNQVLRRIEKDRFLTPIVDDKSEDCLVSLADPLSDLTRRETIESVRQAVLALPVHYREVVVLCDLHGMSYAEAAEALGCALGTVRSRLHRARALLVEKLRPGRDAEQPTTQAGVVRILV